MKISYQTNTTFTSRNAKIRFADNLARRVNNEFPRISSTKVQTLSKIKDKMAVLSRIQKQIILMRDEIKTTMNKDTQIYSQVKSIINLIKNEKVGNCSESSFLTLVSARVNGLKNCFFGYVESPKGYNYDHSFIIVGDGEKPYIIDAWFGFADYVPNTIKRYQNEFRHCFDFKEARTNEMVIKIDNDTVFDSFNKEFDKKDLRKIKKIVPNLIANKD